MNSMLHIEIGDSVISYWMKRILSERTTTIEDFAIECFRNRFMLTVRANYHQVKGKVQYDFELVSIGKDSGCIDMVAFSMKPVGVLSTMAKPVVYQSIKPFEPGVRIINNILSVNILSAVAMLKPAMKAVLNEFELHDFSIFEGRFSCLFHSKVNPSV